jgi:hypothetical protein
VIIWGGDDAPTKEGLRLSIISVQRAAAMNFPIWGSDTCGYDQLFSDPASHEVCMRWFAFSAFTPLMEMGPMKNFAPWARPPEGTEGPRVDKNGYSFTPVFDRVHQAGRRPDLLVYFTDADGAFPKAEPPFPVIWLVKGKSKVPWGQRIQLN